MTATITENHPPEPLTIYTIGHSNVPAYKIVELLKAQCIEELVDVRSSPYSKYASQFNREMFQSILNQAGIAYKFAGEYLGGRPKDPTCYKSGQLPTGHVDFLHEVDYPAVMTKGWYQKGINRLLEIATDTRTAIMCSEEDPARCHRQHLISQTLLQKGIEVLHIRSNGQIQKAWLLAEEKTSKEEVRPAEQLDLLAALKLTKGSVDETPIEPELEYEPLEDEMAPGLFPDFIESQPFTSAAKKKTKKSKKGADPDRNQAELERLQKWIEQIKINQEKK
jgi:hypothetical protein